MGSADDRSKLIATSSLAKAELSLLRAKPATAAAVLPVAAASPKTPQFDLARSASSLLFTLFVERAQIDASSRAPATIEPSDFGGDMADARKAALRTATLYASRPADTNDAAPSPEPFIFSAQANIPPTIAQASLAAQSGLVAVLGQVSRGLDAKKIESFIKERPAAENSAQTSDRNLLIMAVIGAASAAALLWIGILH